MKKIILIFLILISSIHIADSYTCTIDNVRGTITCPDQKIDRAEFVENVKRIQNQAPDLELHGTEYQILENGKIFLQLSESGSSINNASCLLDIFYPNNTFFIKDSPMIYLNDSKGIYFYPLAIPNITGLFMASASCNFASKSISFYNPDEFPFLNNLVNLTVNTGTTSGTVLAINQFDDNTFMKAVTTTTGISRNSNLTFEWDLDNAGLNLTNFTSLDFVFSGQSDQINTMNFYIFNFISNNFEKMTNSLTFSSTATSLNPSPLDDYSSNFISNLSKYVSIDNIIRIKTSTDTGVTTATMWFNFLNLKIRSNLDFISDLKGSSELHVTDFLYNAQNSLNLSLSQHEAIDSHILAINVSIMANINGINQSIISKLLEINASLIQGLINLNASLDVNVTINQTAINQSARLELNQCFNTTNQTFMLFIIVIIAAVLLALAFYFGNYLLGILSSFIFFILAFYINSCARPLGIIIGAIGIIIFVFFTFIFKPKE